MSKPTATTVDVARYFITDPAALDALQQRRTAERIAQGLPPTIVDTDALDALVRLERLPLADTSAESTPAAS